MRPFRVLAFLILAMSATQMAHAVEHIEVLKGRFRRTVTDTARGRLAVIDGQVVFTPSMSDQDLWNIVDTPDGLRIQAQGGRWDGWLLTADATGKVFLARTTEKSSTWKRRTNSAGGWNLVFDGPDNRERAFLVEDRPSSLIDRDGAKHVVYAVHVQERGAGRAPAELHTQAWLEAPPALLPREQARRPSSSGPRSSVVNAVLFHPRRYPEGHWDTEGQPIDDVWFKTADGARINGWFSEAAHPRAVVLYAEGNAGNITSRRWVLKLLRERMNVSVLLFDYRGYGRSEGEPSTSGILADARAARHWLADRTGVPEKSIVLMGTSLGGSVMVDLAANDGAAGLILENTFSSLGDAAAHFVGPLAARLVVGKQLDSVSKIRNYRGPLLQTHGDADTVIPYELGRRLFDAANEPKQFVRAPGGNHNDPPSAAFLDALERFLDGAKMDGANASGS